MRATGQLFLAAAWGLVPRAAHAQAPRCPLGPTTSQPAQTVWVVPHATDVIRKVAVKAITGLGYTVADSAGQLRTAAKFSWPRNSSFTLWRRLVYPGAHLTIALDSAGPWTRIHLTTRLECRTDQHPPPGHPQDVNFDVFVVNETHDEAFSAIMSPLENLDVKEFASSCAPLLDSDSKIDICRRMAKRDPRNPEAWRQLAIALGRFYRTAEAREAMQHAIALEGERRETYDGVGLALLYSREFGAADTLFEHAIGLWPDDPVLAYHLGRTRLALHQLEPAAAALALATGRDSTFGLAHAYAAVPLAQLGQVQESRQHCARATPLLESILPDSAAVIDVWLGLAFCASLLGRHQNAAAYFSRAVALDPNAARATPELVNLVDGSIGLVGLQPPAAVPPRP